MVAISKKRRLLIRLFNPLEQDVHKTLNDMEKKVISIFKYHIGKENALPAVELFKEVIGTDPDNLNVFERSYLWSIIKGILQRLRSSEVLFVVNNNFSYYVLKTMDEYKTYENKVDNLIAGLKEIKHKAYDWVVKKKYLKVM